LARCLSRVTRCRSLASLTNTGSLSGFLADVIGGTASAAEAVLPATVVNLGMVLLGNLAHLLAILVRRLGHRHVTVHLIAGLAVGLDQHDVGALAAQSTYVLHDTVFL